MASSEATPAVSLRLHVAQYQHFISLLLANLSTCILLSYSYAYAPYQVLKKCGIRGPKPLPIVGNLALQKQVSNST